MTTGKTTPDPVESNGERLWTKVLRTVFGITLCEGRPE